MNSDIVSDVTDIKMKEYKNMKTNINNKKEIVDCNFAVMNDINTILLEGNKNTITGHVEIVKGNLNILSGDIKAVNGNYNTIFSESIETVNGNFNKIYGRPKNITGNFNKYVECLNVVGTKNRKI
jgi:hypothetical protein